MSSEQKPQLKLFIDHINTDHDDPFKEDTLERKKLADNLTSIINAIDGKRVISLNGQWGSGKTTFLDMWQKAHEKKKEEEQHFTIIYFDAFKYDYYDDPFIAISGAIMQKVASEFKEKFKDKSVEVAKRLIPALAKGIGKASLRVVGVNDDIINGLVSDLSEILGDEIANFSENQKPVEAFKEFLAEAIKEMNGKKLVIVVDELDRCKPTFAVELLERIKHIFDVEGLVFLLSMNPDQMQETIKCVYGQGVDANTYLHKFIDWTMILPTTSEGKYIGTSSLGPFNSDLIRRHGWYTLITRSDCDFILNTLNKLPSVLPITPRTQRKIVQHLTAVIAIDHSSYKHLAIFQMFVLLIAIRQMEPEIYVHLKEGAINIPKTLHSALGKVFPEVWELIQYLIGKSNNCRNISFPLPFGPSEKLKETINHLSENIDDWLDREEHSTLFWHYISIIEQFDGIPE